MSTKRILSGLLALVLLLGNVPVTALAAEVPVVLTEEVLETPVLENANTEAATTEVDILETTAAPIIEPTQGTEATVTEPVVPEVIIPEVVVKDEAAMTIIEMPGTFQPGEIKTGELALGIQHNYRVTVPEDGIYFFAGDENAFIDSHFAMILYDSEGEYVPDEKYVSQGLLVDLIANQEYLLTISGYGSGLFQYSIVFDKVKTAAESIQISSFSDLFLLPGETGDISCRLYPWYIDGEDITWTSSDESVAQITDSWFDINYGSIDIEAVGSGVAEITATTKSGLSAQIPVTVATPAPIQIGQTIEVTFAESEFSNRDYYVFEAQNDGRYFLRQNSGDPYYDLSCSVRREEDGQSLGNPFTAEKGKRYIIRFVQDSYYTLNGVSSYQAVEGSFTLEKVAAPESISLSRSNITGVVGDMVSFEYEYSPEYALESGIVWSIDGVATGTDISIVSITPENGACNIQLLDVGTATITATLPNGTSASCTVTAVKPGTISCGTPQKLNLKSGQTHGFRFTPPETAAYHVWDSIGTNTHFELLDEAGTNLIDSMEPLTAGETYLLIVTNKGADTQQQIYINKRPKATKLVLEKSRYTGEVGHYLTIFFSFSPDTAAAEKVVDWDSSNTDVVSSWSYRKNYCSVYLQAVGSTTMTATTESGLQASCVITVVEEIEEPDEPMGDPISCGFSKKYTKSQSLKFSFTPKVSDEYVFWNNGTSSAAIIDDIVNADGQSVRSNYSINYASFYAVAGETYSIQVNLESGTNFELHLDELVEPTKLDLQISGTPTGNIYQAYVDEEIDFHLTYSPGNARRYDRHDVNWIIDNPDILDITLGKTEDAHTLKAGTVTVTAQAGNAVGTCTIQVADAKKIAVGFQETVTLQPGERVGYVFTPTQAGSYVFWDESANQPYIESIYSNYTRVQFDVQEKYLSANYSYTFIVTNTQDTKKTFTLHLDKCTALTGIDFVKDAYQGILGDQSFPVVVQFLPGNSYDTDITWTVKDENIAQINYAYDNDAHLKLVGRGTTTITATAGGYSASATITVKDKVQTKPVVTISNRASDGVPHLSWSAVKNAKSYQIWRSSSKTGTYSLLYTTKNLYYNHLKAVPGSAYYYKVRAVLTDGTKSQYSNIVSSTCDLPRPTGLKATNLAASGKNRVTWNAVEGAEKYEVWYSTTGREGTYSRIWTTKYLYFNHNGGEAGQLYYYKVKALHSNANASSALSVSYQRTCDLARPTIKVVNDAATGKNKISWNKVDGASKYQVWYSTTGKDGSFKLLYTTKALSHIHKGGIAGRMYYYKVKAIHINTNANSVLSLSYKRTCDLARPSIAVTQDSATGKNQITWNAVSGAAKYQVWYSSSGKSGTYKLLMTTKNTSHIHKNGVTGSNYYYKVKAIHTNTAANSAFSIACKSHLPNVTVSVSNVAATGKIKLTWNSVTDAQKYEVWYSTSKDGTYTLLKTTAQTSHIHAAAKAGQTYYYKVKEVYANTDIAAPFSEIVSCVCDLAQPVVTIVHDSSATEKYGYDVMRLSWTDVGASNYILYYYHPGNNVWTKFYETTTTAVLMQENSYSYKIQAIHTNTNANSAMSNAVSLLMQTSVATIQDNPQSAALSEPIVIPER